MLRQISAGVKVLATSSTAVGLVVANALCYVILGADTVLLVVVSDQRLGLGPDGIGLLLTGIGVGGVLAAGVVNRLASSPRLGTIVTLALVVYTLPIALLVVVSDPLAAFGIQVVRGAGMLAITVLAVTAVQRALPPEMIARGVGVLETLAYLGLAAGALIVPTLLMLIGLDGTLLALSVGLSLLVVAAVPFSRRMDRDLTAQLARLKPRIDALEALDLFDVADRGSIERLASVALEQVVPAGTRIITEGDPSDAFYVVLDGRVLITTEGGDVTAPPVTLGPGAHVGEIGLLSAGPRTANVDALTAVTVLRVPGDTFVAALAGSPPSAAFLDTARRRLTTTHPTRELTQIRLQSGSSGVDTPERSGQRESDHE